MCVYGGLILVIWWVVSLVVLQGLMWTPPYPDAYAIAFSLDLMLGMLALPLYAGDAKEAGGTASQFRLQKLEVVIPLIV